MALTLLADPADPKAAGQLVWKKGRCRSLQSGEQKGGSQTLTVLSHRGVAATSNLMCAETHKSQEKYILQVSPRKREAEIPESGMATSLTAITSIPQVQDVQDVTPSPIIGYFVITDYTVILPKKPSTKPGESFT